MSRQVAVPPHRLDGWFAGFERRNGPIATIEQTDGDTVIRTERGGQARIRDCRADAQSLGALAETLLGRGTAVVVLVRRGGFSIARATFNGAAATVLASKTGSRYVQGRTAAGGQSQQRFARRRANQAAQLAGAAAAAARTVLGDQPGPTDLLVTGGDRQLLEEVLAQHPLRVLTAGRTVHVQIGGDPRRHTIDEALESARSVTIEVTNAPPAG